MSNLRLGRFVYRWRHLPWLPNEGYWLPLGRMVCNADGTPFMCPMVYGTPAASDQE